MTKPAAFGPLVVREWYPYLMRYQIRLINTLENAYDRYNEKRARMA